jgi:hypothetical protein
MSDNRFLARCAAFAAAAAFVTLHPALAQQPAPAATPAATPASSDSKTFSQQQLDELLAPVALYPDALLAQVLMAATYPLAVVEAARWQKENPNLKDKALEDALEKQTWDPAVKSLTAVPQVLTMMSEKLDWTQKLGDAFLGQQEAVMKTVQGLRTKAQSAGNLKTTPEQTVTSAVENNTTVIKIEQPNPQVVSVPVYNPATVYGPWWYSAPPPYYYYPPGYAYGSGLAFATGVFVGAAIWGNIGWGNNNVNINVNKYNNFNKTNISNGNWNHNAQNRQGVGYRDNATANKYGKGGDSRAASQSRDQFRGRAEQGRSQMQSMDRGQLQAADRSAGQQRSGGGDRASSGSRDFGGGGGGNRPSAGTSSRGGGGSGGFSGAGGGGASTRAASSRGGASRGGGGGGRGGGGRR